MLTARRAKDNGNRWGINIKGLREKKSSVFGRKIQTKGSPETLTMNGDTLQNPRDRLEIHRFAKSVAFVTAEESQRREDARENTKNLRPLHDRRRVFVSTLSNNTPNR